MPTPSTMTARVVQDSINDRGDRLTTMVLTFARSGLSEINTHRAFSRSSASSRAIPVAKIVAAVRENAYVPRRFSLAQSGMSTDSFAEHGSPEWEEAAAWWENSRDRAIKDAERGLALGLHKQDVNRILEPFMMHTAIVSSTDWQNFFDLRTAVNENGNPLAYLPVYEVAVAAQDALAASTPVFRPAEPLRHTQDGPLGSWHLPLISDEERATLGPEIARQVSVARCARSSYFRPDGRSDLENTGKSVEDEVRLYERLLNPGEGSAPHAAPFEHVAAALPGVRSGNFEGWLQLRQCIE